MVARCCKPKIRVEVARLVRVTDGSWKLGADEAISVEEALRAYTVGSAKAL